MVGPILVVSAEWQTRALLAAQLGETTGREVVSAPDPDGALLLTRAAHLDPALVIVDAGQQLTAEQVELLAAALPGVRLVLVVSALRRESYARLRDRCVAFLVRPVTIGQVAQAAADTLAGASPHRYRPSFL